MFYSFIRFVFKKEEKQKPNWVLFWRHQSFFVYLLVITDIKGEINDIWLFQYQSNVRCFMICLSDEYVGNVSKFSELKNYQYRLNRDNNVVIADNFSPNLWRNNIINVLFIWHMPGNCVNCQVLKKLRMHYLLSPKRAPLNTVGRNYLIMTSVHVVIRYDS